MFEWKEVAGATMVVGVKVESVSIRYGFDQWMADSIRQNGLHTDK